MSLPFKQKIMRDFSRAAKTYDNYAILQRKVADHLFRLLKLNNDRNILDIGCGTGYFHELLRKNKLYYPLYQIDISKEMCAVAASYASPEEYGGTYTSTCDMHNLPFAANSFSTIFSSMTMQWSEDLEKVFLEAKRVLENNGNFAFSIVGEGSLLELKQAFEFAGLNPPIHSFLGIDEIKEKIINAGFREFEISSETITMYYENINTILRSIKHIGASYKSNQAGGLRGRGYFAEVEKIYHNNFADKNGLPLSWNITYIASKY